MQNLSLSGRLALTVALLCCRSGLVFGQSGPDQPREISELNKSSKPPKAIKRAEPEFPYNMARAGLIGTVNIAFIIDKEGNVRNPYVLESNNPWFERPAIDAILGWKFQPAEMNGHAVDTRVAQRIDFDLDSGGKPPNLWRISKGKGHDKLPADLQWETPPQPVSTQFPVYPFEQLKAGTAGKVLASYIVAPDGRVIKAVLIEATAPEFGLAVLAMIDAWRFQPAKHKDGTPCYANLGSEYDFRPTGRGEVPVSDEARQILRDLAKKPESIATLKDLDQPLKALSQRPPVYPTAFEKTGQTGDAQIEFYVDKKGDVQLPRIISSSAAEFGYAAVQAVATWRFAVPQKGGKPVVVRARIPIDFSLAPGKGANH